MTVVSPVQLRETNKDFPFRVLLDKPDVALGNHWHKEVEIIYLLQGGLHIYINGIKYLLDEGDIVVMPSGDIHGAECSINNVRIVVQFDECIIQNNYLTEQEYAQIREKLNMISRVSTQWPSVVKEKVKEIVFSLKDEYEKYKISPEPFIKMSILTLLHELISFSYLKIPTSDEQKLKSKSIRSKDILEKLEKVLHYINNQYMENITLEDAANIINFAPNYFVRYWKKYMGLSFHTYLNQVRISIAISMLLNGTQQINEISHQVGFHNVKTFNRIFKQITGTSPSQYRKRYL